MDALTGVFICLLAVAVIGGTIVIANLIKKFSLEFKEIKAKGDEAFADLVADKVVAKLNNK